MVNSGKQHSVVAKIVRDEDDDYDDDDFDHRYYSTYILYASTMAICDCLCENHPYWHNN